MNHLTYAICDIATDMQNIDFSQVITNSSQTARRSLDNTLFVLKYDLEPTFITTSIVVPSEVLDHEEALALMATPEWTPEEPPA